MCIFQKIIDREIPAEIIHEDHLCIAFKDINPVAPTHFLIVPKKHIESMAHVEDEDQEVLGHMMVKASELTRKLRIADEGYRLVVNTNYYGGQTVPHLHIHVIGGREMLWPPG